MALRILVLDGIGSHGTTSKIIDHTAHRLGDDLDVTPDWINWDAAMAGVGGEGSWVDNSDEAVEMIADRFNATEDDVVLLAYSGGNRPVHDFLDRHPEHHHRLRAVGLMSDPYRPRDRWQAGLGDPGGYGIMGEDHGPIPDRTFWTAVPGDLVCSAPADSILRYLADSCEGDPDLLVQTFIRNAQRGRFQLAAFLGLPPLQWFMGLGPRIANALWLCDGYLFAGRHTRHYLGPVKTGSDERSLAERLADSILWKVRNG